MIMLHNDIMAVEAEGNGIIEPDDITLAYKQRAKRPYIYN